MTLKDQWKKMKDNWLIIIVLVLVAGFLYGGDDIISSIQYSGNYAGDYGDPIGMMAESVGYGSTRMMKSGIMPPISSGGDFAAEVDDRKITKTASLSTEIEFGTFQEGERQLKAIISSTNSLLLNENVNKYDQGRKSYYSGSYSLKVDVRVYDAVVSQLKQIGEIQSFSENAQDITGTYTNIQTELEAERARLQRYKQMLAEATLIADKIELNDRIFNQERTIKYLEDALTNQDEQVEYASVYLQMSEKQSEFANVAFVTFGQLVTGFVSSASNVFKLLFSILPWALGAVILWLIVRWVRNRK
ncbi:MAG: DUF4349 domain-containing protein [Nanoarchaeota archaeon]|nr:DUF4349 domain-containing protein [Nanoarchaeota archaeon]